LIRSREGIGSATVIVVFRGCVPLTCFRPRRAEAEPASTKSWQRELIRGGFALSWVGHLELWFRFRWWCWCSLGSRGGPTPSTPVDLECSAKNKKTRVIIEKEFHTEKKQRSKLEVQVKPMPKRERRNKVLPVGRQGSPRSLLRPGQALAPDLPTLRGRRSAGTRIQRTSSLGAARGLRGRGLLCRQRHSILQHLSVWIS
jgi:hypothetical protein